MYEIQNRRMTSDLVPSRCETEVPEALAFQIHHSREISSVILHAAVFLKPERNFHVPEFNGETLAFHIVKSFAVFFLHPQGPKRLGCA